jgi:DNA polymerase-3 subunit delta
MKFYSNNLSELIKRIKNSEIKSVLLHGTNQGFATTAIKKIAKDLNLIISEFDYKEITASKLQLIANSQNFFGSKELIKITKTTKTIDKLLKDLLAENNFHNFICFVSDESLPASGIRKFFEEHSNLASMGVYYENEQTIARIILQQCTKNNKTIEEDALSYLKSHLQGDHQLIKSELDKLFYFTHDKAVITREDVLQVLSHDFSGSGDEMCIFFAKKEPEKFLKEVAKLQEQSKNEVLMIRALIRYYLNIYVVALKLEDGGNIDHAIKSLYPPIFFKYVDDFKQVLRKHSSKDALRCLKLLQEAEISYKSNPQYFDLFSTYLGSH